MATAAHDLPVLVLDAKPLRCLLGCGKAAWLDQASLIASNGKRAVWICQDGHDGVVRIAPAAPDTERRRR